MALRSGCSSSGSAERRVSGQHGELIDPWTSYHCRGQIKRPAEEAVTKLSKLTLYFVLQGKSTKVHHNAGRRRLSEHGSYKAVAAADLPGRRACGYCRGRGR
jgi:hypothetical protein